MMHNRKAKYRHRIRQTRMQQVKRRANRSLMHIGFLILLANMTIERIFSAFIQTTIRHGSYE